MLPDVCKTKGHRKELIGHIEDSVVLKGSQYPARISSLGISKANSVSAEIVNREVTTEENVTWTSTSQ